jgi:hypothetical protein
MQLFQGGAIDITTMLENTSYPFATKLLEAVKSKQADAQQMQQAMMEAQQMQQTGTVNPQMQKALNNNNAGPQDGIIQKVA